MSFWNSSTKGTFFLPCFSPFLLKLIFSRAKMGYRSSNDISVWGREVERGEKYCIFLPCLAESGLRHAGEKESLSSGCLPTCHLDFWWQTWRKGVLELASFTMTTSLWFLLFGEDWIFLLLSDKIVLLVSLLLVCWHLQSCTCKCTYFFFFMSPKSIILCKHEKRDILYLEMHSAPTGYSNIFRWLMRDCNVHAMLKYFSCLKGPTRPTKNLLSIF